MAVALGASLFLAARGGSSTDLGDANGGIAVAGDTPSADTESATRSGAAGDATDDRSEPVAPRTTTTTIGATGGTAGRATDAEEARPADAVGADGAQQALNRGRVPGLEADDPFQETLAAYWALLHQARQEPWTYDDADLDAVAVGAGRDRFLQRVDNLGAAESIVVPDGSRFEVRLSGMRIGTEVAVGEECVVDDLVHLVVRDARTGERYEPPLVTDDRVFTNRYGVTFQLVDGVWKVAERVLIEDREGLGGCARDW